MLKPNQVRDMTLEEMIQLREETAQNLFNLRLRRTAQHLDNPLRLRTLRREIARLNTIIKDEEKKVAAGEESNQG